jgi:hypothetical protein
MLWPEESEETVQVWRCIVVVGRAELLQKHAKLERDIRMAEERVAKAVPGPEKIRSQEQLDELRVRLGEIEWQLANKFGPP